jgi:hypothetical protein
MVDTLDDGSHKTDLMRIIKRASITKYADQCKVEYTPSSFEGTHEGAPQWLNLGSCIHISDTSALSWLDLSGLRHG